MESSKIQDQISNLIHILGWDENDNVVVEVGGTVVSGIHQPPEANERWSTPFGVRKYNKDAFIVIKNVDRNPVISSKDPNENSNENK